ncbi:hypothetical protein VTH06DRAFT_6529 [Thermothelomyces fergusii]
MPPSFDLNPMIKHRKRTRGEENPRDPTDKRRVYAEVNKRKRPENEKWGNPVLSPSPDPRERERERKNKKKQTV